MKWIGEIKTIAEYIESLHEQAKQTHEARLEKYRGGWNYEARDRACMAAEERLLLRIAAELVQFREDNYQSLSERAKKEVEG